MEQQASILYCHCAFAQVVPKDVKNNVLKSLTEGRIPFEAVADLCELSARGDQTLKRIADKKPIKIAACYPRAIRCLFAAANAPLAKDNVEILNMRVEAAEKIIQSLKSAK